MKDAIIAVTTVIIVLLFTYSVVRIGDYLNNPDSPTNKGWREQKQKQEASLVKWCRDQNGTAKFNRYNEYQGCEVK